jgi:hypothetical protein
VTKNEQEPVKPEIILDEDVNNNSKDKKKKDKRKSTRFNPSESVMPENADAEDWNWFTNIRTKIEQSNQELKEKIVKSNKAIVRMILHSL